MDISESVTEYQSVETKPKGQSRKTQRKQQDATQESGNQPYVSLGLEDRMAIDSFMSTLDGPRQEHTKAANLKRKRVESVRPVGDISTTRCLIEAAMDVMLFGGSKRCIGFKVLEGESLPGLANISPGVFHIPYLKVGIVVHGIIYNLLNFIHRGYQSVLVSSQLLQRLWRVWPMLNRQV